MCIIAQDFPQLSYCPFLMPTVTTLLHHLDADRALGTMHAMVRVSVHAHEWRFFLCTPREVFLYSLVFIDTLRSLMPVLFRYLHKLGGNKLAWTPFWRELFSSMFISVLPLQSMLRVMDAFVLEGVKVLYRVALGVLRYAEDALLQAPSMEVLNNRIKQEFAACVGARFEECWAIGFRFTLPRSEFTKLRTRNQKLHHQDTRASSADIYLRQLPALSAPSSILTDDLLHTLWKWVPARYRQHDLDLVFDTVADGYSLQTLYAQCADKEPLLLVLRSTQNRCLGAYLPEAFSKRPTDRPRYFGTGEAFVFTISPDGTSVEVYPWAKMDRAKMIAERATGSGIKVVYRSGDAAATANEYFVLADAKRLVIGGGSTGPALSLDDALEHAHTHRCETFDSVGLHGPDSQFQVTYVEVYTFV